MQVVSLTPRRDGSSRLMEILARRHRRQSSHRRRGSGRLGDASAVPHLLARRPTRRAIASCSTPSSTHSLSWRIRERTAAGLASEPRHASAPLPLPWTKCPAAPLRSDQVHSAPEFGKRRLRRAARWIVGPHPEWGGDLADWIRQRLTDLPDQACTARRGRMAMRRLLEYICSIPFAQHPGDSGIAGRHRRRSKVLAGRAADRRLRVMAQCPS